MKGMLVSLCSTLFGLVMLTIAPVAMAGDPINCSGGCDVVTCDATFCTV